MEPMNLNVPSYPMLGFVARYGVWLAWLITALVVIAGVCLTASSGSLAYTVAGIVAGAIAYILARTLVEMVRLITDMLLPK